jgi:DNA-binding PadR family transcriptional regulator
VRVEEGNTARSFYGRAGDDDSRDVLAAAAAWVRAGTAHQADVEKRTPNDLLQIEEGSLYPAFERVLKQELVEAE